MKTNETIKQNIRDEVQRIILCNIYSDRRATAKWIIDRFEENGVPISLDGLIELSGNHSSFFPPNPYNHNIRPIYKAMELEDIMTYQQFFFELPRIWYTTLSRLIIEWRDEFWGNQDTAY